MAKKIKFTGGSAWPGPPIVHGRPLAKQEEVIDRGTAVSYNAHPHRTRMARMIFRPGRPLLFFLLGLAAVLPDAWAQESKIELTPRALSALPCTELMANIGVDQGDMMAAMKLAAASGYRQGYVVGYLHGSLDVGGKKKPLTRDELETFAGTYELVCTDDPKLSIYEAARRSMSFQSR
jgi:hypothetical protein